MDDSIYSVPTKLGQNYIDYIMKQYQVWVDALFGADNDNSDVPAVDPATFNGLTGFTIYTEWAGVPKYFTLQATTMVNIGKNNDGNVISGHTLRTFLTGNHGSANDAVIAWFNSSNYYCDMWGSYEQSPTVNHIWYFKSTELGSEEINANWVLQRSQLATDYSERPYLLLNGTLSMNENGTLTGNGLAMLGGGCMGCPIQNTPSYTNVPAINNVNSGDSNYHTINYTTNEGDTVTVSYNSYAINFGTSGISVSFDDIFDIMANFIAPDLSTPELTLTVPTYEDLKYSDMGDFYIAPLHQYGQLPTAPTFENTLDLSNYPLAIGSVATRYIDFLPASISALLAGAVIVSAIVAFIRRDV